MTLEAFLQKEIADRRGEARVSARQTASAGDEPGAVLLTVESADGLARLTAQARGNALVGVEIVERPAEAPLSPAAELPDDNEPPL